MDWKKLINWSELSKNITINNDRCKIRANYLDGKHDRHKDCVLLVKKRINELIEELYILNDK